MTMIAVIGFVWFTVIGLVIVYVLETINNNLCKLAELPPKPHQESVVVFPTSLRKMWSGAEVQEWLDEVVNKRNNQEWRDYVDTNKTKN